VMVTPFCVTGLIDWEDLTRWLKFQTTSSVTGLVLLGTTSETPTLTRTEQLDIVKFVNKYFVDNNVNKILIAAVGGNFSEENREFAISCAPYCDAFMVTVPHYNKPTQQGIIEHFKHICNDHVISTMPVMMYNIPSRCGVNAEASTIVEIVKTCQNVIALKDATGSVDQIIELKRLLKENNVDLKIFSGDDKLVLAMMSNGSVGVISVLSNVYPQYVCDIVQLCLNNKFKEAYTLYIKNMPQICNSMFCETNPIPVKHALYLSGIFSSNTMRLPMTALSESKKPLVLAAMNSMDTMNNVTSEALLDQN